MELRRSALAKLAPLPPQKRVAGLMGWNTLCFTLISLCSCYIDEFRKRALFKRRGEIEEEK
jgi:hypothetical protein